MIKIKWTLASTLALRDIPQCTAQCLSPEKLSESVLAPPAPLVAAAVLGGSAIDALGHTGDAGGHTLLKGIARCERRRGALSSVPTRRAKSTTLFDLSSRLMRA